jgi:AraC family ethanolamine operon transcriptional activator
MGDAVHGERRHELSNAKKYSAVVSAALDAIDADLSGKYTAADLSELIGVSERRLRSALREELGCSLLQAVTRQRLLHARTLLLANRQKNQSIREIAQQVGLTRMGSFIKTYKEMFGELPSDTLRRTT